MILGDEKLFYLLGFPKVILWSIWIYFTVGGSPVKQAKTIIVIFGILKV